MNNHERSSADDGKDRPPPECPRVPTVAFYAHSPTA